MLHLQNIQKHFTFTAKCEFMFVVLWAAYVTAATRVHRRHLVFGGVACHVMIPSCCRLKNGQGVPLDDAEGERLMAEAVALGFDAEAAAKAAPGQ